tara:strand:- start:1660 stop:2472 length:813 start_codon:yes stop_codon:yes gene_type:complete
LTKLSTYNDFQLEYRLIGNGKKLLLAFHGFGQDTKVFDCFQKTFEATHTIVAINLFHHGNSKYPETRIQNNTLTKPEFKAIINNLISELNIEQFDVMGYSLGGKIALCIAEAFPEKTTNVILIAPDGIKINPWYHFVSKTWIGQKLYTFVLRNPKPFLNIVDFANRLHIIDNKLKRFVFLNMDDKTNRLLVYKVWMTYRYINPNIAEFIKKTREQQMNVWQFFGEYDKIIPPSIGQKFSELLNQENHFFTLKIGHNMLSEQTARLIHSKL